MKTINRVQFTLCLLLTTLTTSWQSYACQSDMQCRAPRVCIDGSCQDPDDGLQLACAFYGSFNANFVTGVTEQPMSQRLKKIASSIGLTSYPQILTGPVDTALARIKRNTRQIVYNPTFMKDLLIKKGEAAVDFVLAHELAHHFLAHVYIDDDAESYKKELEADRVATNILYKLNASKDETLSAVDAIPTVENSSHPGTQTRKNAIATYYDELKQMSTAQEQQERIRLAKLSCEQNQETYWDGSSCVNKCPSGQRVSNGSCVDICSANEKWNGTTCEKRYQPVSILSFTTNNDELTVGNSALLRWQTKNAKRCTLEDDNNYSTVRVNANDSKRVRPKVNIEYTLSCTGYDNSSDTSNVAILVEEKLTAYCCDNWGRQWCRITDGSDQEGAPCYCNGVIGTGFICLR